MLFKSSISCNSEVALLLIEILPLSPSISKSRSPSLYLIRESYDTPHTIAVCFPVNTTVT
jgi:hypothetical protein